MSSKNEDVLKLCGNPEGDGCVVNYKGGREYWCRHADMDTTAEDEKEGVCWVYCTLLKRNVPAATWETAKQRTVKAKELLETAQDMIQELADKTDDEYLQNAAGELRNVVEILDDELTGLQQCELCELKGVCDGFGHPDDDCADMRKRIADDERKEANNKELRKFLGEYERARKARRGR